MPIYKQNGKIAPVLIDDKNDQKVVSVLAKTANDDDDNSDETESITGIPDNDEFNENDDLSESKEKYDDDDKWKRFQEEARRENSLETKDRTTHQVHCPYFPSEKFEWWWVYLADKKNHNLITAPLQVCSLQDREELQLKFTAPSTPGQYIYSVYLRSDSYMDFDQFEHIKVFCTRCFSISFIVMSLLSYRMLHVDNLCETIPSFYLAKLADVVIIVRVIINYILYMALAVSEIVSIATELL